MTSPLGPGSRLGTFEITARLGAGGMGEVWRARDTRLQRDVAIKVLPAALVGDPERRARFEREARVLASLNHPHIGALLALEEAGGSPALVLELVEGPTLAERLSRDGALPSREVVAIARAIAEAMEYAHEQGVVHRDLKPANIKFTNDDAVKVLDFGLAKALSADPESSVDASLTHSPTRTLGTRAGVLLGTAAYMSPEQARGKPVDRRADIWAFGVVVFEMLTGRQLFGGETASDAIARILEREPDWASLPASTPPRLVELLRRCLEKDARKRLRDIGDARLELEAIAAAGDSGTQVRASAGTRVAWVPMALAALVALAAGLAMGIAWRSGQKPSVQRLSVSLPEEVTIRMASFVDGGRTLIARGTLGGDGGARTQLFRRPLDAFQWTAIPGTEGVVSYDFGDDDRWIYMVTPRAAGSGRQRLTRVPTDGSAPPSDVCEWRETYGPWEVKPDGRILVVHSDTRSFTHITRGQDEPEPWKPFQSEMTPEDLWLESVAPDGRSALATMGYFGASGWSVAAVSIDLESGRITVLVENASSPRAIPSGFLLVGRGERVLAAPFDIARQRITAEPVAVLDGLMAFDQWDGAVVSLSSTGTLLYRPAGRSVTQRRLATLDPEGRWSEWSAERHEFQGECAVTADGRRVVATAISPGTDSYEILVFDRDRASARRLLPTSTDDKGASVLSRDGEWVAYQRGGIDSLEGVFVTRVDGSTPPRRVATADRVRRSFHRPMGWLPDGRGLVLESTESGRTRITLLMLDDPAARPTDLVAQPFDVSTASVSHDGRTLAFLSHETGHGEPWVARLENGAVVGAPVPVARQETRAMAWAPDRRTLWCVSPSFEVTAHAVGEDLRATLVGPPRSLAGEAATTTAIRPLAGGELFVVRRADGEAGPERFDLVLGFEQELARRLAQARSEPR